MTAQELVDEFWGHTTQGAKLCTAEMLVGLVEKAIEIGRQMGRLEQFVNDKVEVRLPVEELADWVWRERAVVKEYPPSDEPCPSEAWVKECIRRAINKAVADLKAERDRLRGQLDGIFKAHDDNGAPLYGANYVKEVKS